MFIFEGKTGCGKTLLLELVSTILGDFGDSVSGGIVFGNDTGRTELKDLLEKRLAYMEELNGGQVINSGDLKRIAGATHRVRANYQSQSDAQAQKFHGTLILLTNFLPLFDYKDNAVYQRLSFVPFVRQFPIDAEFKVKMNQPRYLNALFTLLCEARADVLKNPKFITDEHPYHREQAGTTPKDSEVYCATKHLFTFAERRAHLLRSGRKKKMAVPDEHLFGLWMEECCLKEGGEQHVDDLRKKQAYASYAAFCYSVGASPAGPTHDFPRMLGVSGHPVTNAGDGRAGNQQKVTGLRFNPATVETKVGGEDCNGKEWVEFVKNKEPSRK